MKVLNPGGSHKEKTVRLHISKYEIEYQYDFTNLEHMPEIITKHSFIVLTAVHLI